MKYIKILLIPTTFKVTTQEIFTKMNYFSSIRLLIFFSFCIMLLVSLLEMEMGEGLRVSTSAGPGLAALLSCISHSLRESCKQKAKAYHL